MQCTLSSQPLAPFTRGRTSARKSWPSPASTAGVGPKFERLRQPGLKRTVAPCHAPLYPVHAVHTISRLASKPTSQRQQLHSGTHASTRQAQRAAYDSPSPAGLAWYPCAASSSHLLSCRPGQAARRAATPAPSCPSPAPSASACWTTCPSISRTMWKQACCSADRR